MPSSDPSLSAARVGHLATGANALTLCARCGQRPIELTVKALLDEAIQLRHTLYYGIDFTTQPALSDAANRLGGVLAKIREAVE